MSDTIRTVTLTPQEQAAYARGWNRAIEAASSEITDEIEATRLARKAIRALSMPAPAPAQEILDALASLEDLVACRCHEAFKDRGLHDPQCNCDYADELSVVRAALIPASEEGGE